MENMSINNPTQPSDFSKVTTYQAGVKQAAMHRNLQKHCDLILNNYGIRKMQWLIVGTVLDSGKKGVRLTELAITLGTTMAYITTAVNMLESKGMLVRKDHQTDSRSKLISIDPKFVPMCKVIEKALREGLRETIYAKIDPHEFLVYMKVMYQLAAED